MSGPRTDFGTVKILCFRLAVSCVAMSEFDCTLVLIISALSESFVTTWPCCGKRVACGLRLGGNLEISVLCVVTSVVSVVRCPGQIRVRLAL